MKKFVLLSFAVFCFVATSTAQQRVLIDFDAEQQQGVDCFGAGTLDGPISNCVTVVENPDKSGINQSDSVGAYLEPAQGETWMGVFYDVINGGDVDLVNGSSQLCADIWTATNVPFTFKVENPTTGTTPYEGGQIFPANTSQWETVCDDMATFGDVASRLVFFFNIGAVPAADQTYYFDNVIQGNPTSVQGLLEEKGLEVFPNPTTYNLLYNNTEAEAYTITVTNMMGQEMIRLNEFTGNSIRVADLTPGTYVVTFIEETTGRYGSAKFVKH